MAKLGFLKRLIVEDFKKEDQQLVGKIASIFNPALEAITFALTNQLTLTDNFNAMIKEITFQVGSDGKLPANLSFTSTLSGNCRACIVSRVDNLTNSATYPTGGVFPSFTQSGNTITIVNVTGLVAGNKYNVRFELSV